MSQIKISIAKTYDPLTTGSFKNPGAPWVGISKDASEPSPAIARLERLMREYVAGGISSCSILIGGDRGAGKTSLVKKVIERVRRPLDDRGPDGYQKLPEDAPSHDYRTFPRPLLVRVHGPQCLNLEVESIEEVRRRSQKDKEGYTRRKERASRSVLRKVAEAVHRALLDEFGRVFVSLAERGSAEEREQAAQIKLELDDGPSPSRLREMWTLFSRVDGEPAAKLPRPSDRWDALDPSNPKKAPHDQAYRELAAMASSIQLVSEIRRHQDQELDEAGLPKSAEEKKAELKEKAEVSFWKQFATQMLDGGRLVNPLAGFMVGALVFVSVLRADVNIPVSLIVSVLSGFSTTILLNFAAARRQSALLADSGLSAIDRTLPVVLRRMEFAGIFPIVVFDELDKLVGEEQSLERKMEWLVSDLKYFFADQAFVCFLVGHDYYENVLDQSSGEVRERTHVDTFFADRILISHTPDELLRYLGELLPREPGEDEETSRARAFLQQLYLYRAKGHLADLQEVIAADHELKYQVVLEPGQSLLKVPEYLRQVFYQLAVHRVLSDPNTRTMLRKKPDWLQPLHQVLYGPAHKWERGEWSFVPRELCKRRKYGKGGPEEDPGPFLEPLERLVSYLMSPEDLWKPGGDFESSVLGEELRVLKPENLFTEMGALVEPDTRIPRHRYFWKGGFRAWQWSGPGRDQKSIVRFRDDGEREAIERIQSLSGLMHYLSASDLDIENLYGLNVRQSPKIELLLDYTFPSDFDGAQKLKSINDEMRRRKEMCELDHALVQSAYQIRNVLLVASLSITVGNPKTDANMLCRIVDNAANHADFATALTDQVNRLLASMTVTADMKRTIDHVPLMDAYDFAAWCQELEFLAARLRQPGAKHPVAPSQEA